MPQNVPTLVQPSVEFKQQIWKVIASILLFAVVYLILIVLAIWLTGWCFRIGVIIMSIRITFIPILVGLGVILTGIMVTFFLIKFVFAKSGSDETKGVELKESDEPRLFEFIRTISTEVDTHFPRKIFLVPEVNASVFYSSSFWSLFFPIRKNLNIGLGLVSALSVSEFKAVLAHEFGHFSQRSMRLGSYVYYVNQAIYNMLFQNKGWAGALGSFAELHAIFHFFANISVKIVQGIQWILQKMYLIINKQYLGLSREMEFHADAIAASVAGSDNMIQALRQVNVGSWAFHETIQQCNEMLQEKKAPVNFYAGQEAVSCHMTEINELPMSHGRPVITREFVEKQRLSRVVLVNQWASHPTDEHREEKLSSLGIPSAGDPSPAWSLFNQASHWQEELTAVIYRNASLTNEITRVDPNQFEQDYEKEASKKELPRMFKGYYDDRIIGKADITILKSVRTGETVDPEALLEVFRSSLAQQINAINADIETLDNIYHERIEVRTFDFDGQKYVYTDAFGIIKDLEQERARLELALREQDAEIVRQCYHLGLPNDPEGMFNNYLEGYNSLYKAGDLKSRFDKPAIEVIHTIRLYRQYDFATNEQLTRRLFDLLEKQEPELRLVMKDVVRLMPTDETLHQKIEKFLGSDLNYLDKGYPHRINLQTLEKGVLEVDNYLNSEYFARLKSVLEKQEQIITCAFQS